MKKINKIQVILASISLLLIIIAIALFATPFMSYKYSGTTISGFDIAFAISGYNAETTPYLGTLFSFSLTCISLIIAIFNLFSNIKSFSFESKIETTKEQTSIICFLFTLIGLAPFVLNLLVINTTGSTEFAGVISVGGGAISSGLLVLIGTGLIVANNILDYVQSTNLIEDKPDNKDKNISSISNQLNDLKSFKDQGLITDEDYNLKKKQLLDL